MVGRRAGWFTTGDCSGLGAGVGSAGLGCGVGGFCTGSFSSTMGAGAGGGAGDAAWASSEALVLLLRVGAALGSFGSAGLRGFLTFFSGSGAAASLIFGLGPGFLRGSPEAVSPRGAGEVACAGVLAPTTPPTLERRVVEFGGSCSGECGGELRLPGEDVSFASMAAEGRELSRCNCQGSGGEEDAASDKGEDAPSRRREKRRNACQQCGGVFV